MDDKQVTETATAAEETTETAVEEISAEEIVTEETTAEEIAAEEHADETPEEPTIASALKAIADENGGAFPEDTEKMVLRFSEIAPGLTREGRLLDVFLACGGCEALLAVKETTEKEQREAVEKVVAEMGEEYWIDPLAAEMICREFLTAIGAKVTEAEETLCQQADRYYSGDGVAQDKEKAAELYEEAALNGDAVAQYTLGYMCDKGDGIDKDRVKAMFWYEKAADQGHEAAQNRLNVLRHLEEKNAPHPVKPKIEEDEQPKKKRFFGK